MEAIVVALTRVIADGCGGGATVPEPAPWFVVPPAMVVSPSRRSLGCWSAWCPPVVEGRWLVGGG
uniref:Uncharacterized protein n=1 Tax=Leersia perrieri TaxID=77586 RepID=A0A0D9VGV6_9ORYZ